MSARLRTLGLVLAVLGLVFIGGAVFAYAKVQQGDDALRAYSAAQNVNLSYDEDGNFISGGSAEEGEAILSLLEDDWKYPVNAAELDPDDPQVNTASEYMVQMATITYHTLHGKTTVTLPEDSEDVVYNGTTYHAGDTVEFVNDGKYWTGFDRKNPIEGAARGQIWSDTAHALVGELGVGAVTASTLQLGLGVAGFMGGVGGTALVAGLGLVWAAAADKPQAAAAKAPAKKAPAKK